MNARIRELPEDTLRRLADAVAAARIGPPWPDAQVAHAVGGPPWLPGELRDLTAAGVDSRMLGWTVQLLAAERADARRRWEGVELAWTGPDDLVTETRDTGTVARELFVSATRTLLIATYVIDAKSEAKAEALFSALRDRMEEVPALDVRFYVNVPREYKDKREAEIIVREYAGRFATTVWPWARRPQVFYDRRSVELSTGARPSLHAKCVVQDGVRTLITSANLTEAAQLRNIEAGVLVSDEAFARSVSRQFARLVARGYLVPLAL